jgi:hypothetical protein
MASESTGTQAWLAVFREVALELAATSLRFEAGVVPMPEVDLCGVHPSAYIAVLSEHESIHLGISTSPDGVRLLTRALLRVRGDRVLDDSDAVDGLSEILNIVAGKVKSRMPQSDGPLLLGLPIFISGRTHPGADMEQAGTDLRLGPVPCRLTVHRRCRGESRAA